MQQRKKWLRAVSLVSGLALVGAACGSDDEGGGASPTGTAPVEKVEVTIYGQGAWTGPANYLVVPSFQGAQMAFDELNADAGYPATITFEQADTQGSPDNAPPVVEEIVGNPNTVAVHGPGFSGESEASGDTFEEAGIPFVSASATNPGLSQKGWTFWYRGIANDDDQGTPAAQYLAQVLSASSVFVTHDKSTYGQGLAEVVRDTLESEGVDVAGFEGIETGAEDFSALISDIEASSPDAVYFGGYDFDFGKIVKQARDAGLDVPMMSGDGSVSSTLIDLAGSGLTDVYLTCPCNLTGDFVQQYNDKYGGEASSVPIYVAEGYDVANLLGEGIKQAIDGGATTPEEIRAGIKTYLDSVTTDSPYQGVAKSYAFDPSTHELAATERLELIYFYAAVPGEITLEGQAPEVLGG
ncbi:MAG: branched-chain amino acid ABC transporter substrate-binding protein [Actinomycetota bacterium]